MLAGDIVHIGEGDILKKEDREALDYLWENWDSQNLSIGELTAMAKEELSEEILSEIWFLISLKSMAKTALYAQKAIEKGTEESFVHDNLLFGSGSCNTDFNKRDLNVLITYYKNHIARKPDSLISMRCLVEILIENRRYTEAINTLIEANRAFPQKRGMWEIYETWIQWCDGEKEKARARWEHLSNHNLDDYLIQLMIAENYANASEYEPALEKYERAFSSQRGKRKIDSLICQVHIYEILGKSDKALLSVKRIQEVLLKDYGIEEGPEVKVWNEKEKILMKSLEE